MKRRKSGAREAEAGVQSLQSWSESLTYHRELNTEWGRKQGVGGAGHCHPDPFHPLLRYLFCLLEAGKSTARFGGWGDNSVCQVFALNTRYQGPGPTGVAGRSSGRGGTLGTLALWRQRHSYLWSLLASQPNLCGEFQARERSCLKI